MARIETKNLLYLLSPYLRDLRRDGVDSHMIGLIKYEVANMNDDDPESIGAMNADDLIEEAKRRVIKQQAEELAKEQDDPNHIDVEDLFRTPQQRQEARVYRKAPKPPTPHREGWGDW